MRGIVLDPVTGKPVPELERLLPPHISENLRLSRLLGPKGPQMMADSKISALTDGGGFKEGDHIPVDRGGVNYRVSPIGVPVLVYRYKVTGSDKASIDTGVDTADAGSNDWANGDVLEVWVIARTDDAGTTAAYDMTFNNDTGGNYDIQYVYGNDASVAAARNHGLTKWAFDTHGSGGAANYASSHHLTFPGYANTTFYKTGTVHETRQDSSGNDLSLLAAVTYKSTSAISRIKVAGQSSAKLKVGSELLVYKRLSS